jgi:NADPH-dependent curcumin reductase CurA
MTTVNRQIKLASRPVGLPKVSDFQLAYSALPALRPGEVLVKALYLSLDPHLRRQMNPAATAGNERDSRPLDIGEVLTGDAVALVVKSEHPLLRAGDAVEGMLGWQEYAVVCGSELRKIDCSLAPISTALGVLGVPGLTAYFGLLEVSQPRPGTTVVVSGAAGAVGMLVGQIAKIRGCRVVGIVGSDEKVAWLITELGFDAAFNYKAAGDCSAKLDELCPDGVDIYFDIVGGPISEAVIGKINDGARITVCGQVSQYNLKEPQPLPSWHDQLVAKHAKIQGFRVSAFAERFPAALKQLTRWLMEGKLKYYEDVAQGIEAAPQAFIGMLQGKKLGKQLVQLSTTS